MDENYIINNKYEFPSYSTCDVLTTTDNKIISEIKEKFNEELINTNEYIITFNKDPKLWKRFKFNDKLELLEYNDNFKNFIKCDYIEEKFSKSYTNIDCLEEDLLECVYMFEKKNYLYNLIF
jgi:hypothetical protein